VNDDALAALARRQHGVFARWQAVDLGFSLTTIDSRIARKVWMKVVGRTVLAASTTRLSEESQAWAAYLACGRGAVLSGPSAMGHHKLDVPTLDKVWVTIPPERHLRIDGVRTIRETIPTEDIETMDGMNITTVTRSVIDTLRVLPEYLGQSIVDKALLREWITQDDLTTSVEKFAGRRGNLRLRAYELRARSGARSEAERRVHEILNEAGVTGWVADFKIMDAGGALLAVLDVAFERERIAIEIDGLAFHTGPEQCQRDRTRQNRLVNEGWRVLRFTWDDLVRRRGYVIQTIMAELAKR
jgi:very-short-patch-repair endonuclease